jgi:hypothetical protein
VRDRLGFIGGDLSGRFPSARRKAGQSKRRILMRNLSTCLSRLNVQVCEKYGHLALKLHVAKQIAGRQCWQVVEIGGLDQEI